MAPQLRGRPAARGAEAREEHGPDDRAPDAVRDMMNMLIQQRADLGAIAHRCIAEIQQGTDFIERHVQ